MEADAYIRLHAADLVDQYAALMVWLDGDRGLRGVVRTVVGAPREGELGGTVDLIAVALGSGGTGAVLAQVLADYIRSRRSDVMVTVTRGERSVSVDARRVSDVRELLHEVLRDGDQPL